MHVHVSQTQQDCDLQKLFHISACVLWCEISCVVSSLMLELAVFSSSFIRLGCSLPASLMVSQMVGCNLFNCVTTHKFIDIDFLFNVSETGKKNPNSRIKKQA